MNDKGILILGIILFSSTWFLLLKGYSHGRDRVNKLPFDVNVTHILSSGCRGLVQKYVFGVPDHDTQDVTLGLPGGDIDGRGDVGVLGENVHPHVQGALRDGGWIGVMRSCVILVHVVLYELHVYR